MDNDTITVTTEAGKPLQVVVLSRSAEAIWVVIGAGVHSVKCKLVPTRNGMAYAGSVMGRELVYPHSVAQVQADLRRAQPAAPRFRPR
jgi:hypothetical protein